MTDDRERYFFVNYMRWDAMGAHFVMDGNEHYNAAVSAMWRDFWHNAALLDPCLVQRAWLTRFHWMQRFVVGMVFRAPGIENFIVTPDLELMTLDMRDVDMTAVKPTSLQDLLARDRLSISTRFRAGEKAQWRELLKDFEIIPFLPEQLKE